MYPRNLPGGADTLIGIIGATSLVLFLALVFVATAWFLWPAIRGN